MPGTRNNEALAAINATTSIVELDRIAGELALSAFNAIADSQQPAMIKIFMFKKFEETWTVQRIGGSSG